MKPNCRRTTTLAIASSALLSISSAQAQSTLYWDANAATALQTDGAGAWLGANLWWNGATNSSWVSGSNAVFGYSGAGGAVTLAGTTTVESLGFNPFTGTYTIGTAGAGNTITLNNGITKNSGGVVTIVSPLTLGGAQTWTNNAPSNINLQGTTTLVGNLTFDGIGNFDFSNTLGVIAGTGNLIKNGNGQLVLSAGGTSPTHAFTGNIVVNGGSVGFQASSVLSGRNTTLNGGYLGGRFGSGFTWTSGLGTGVNQIQITGGVSGFSGESGSSSSTFQIGVALSTLKWGATTENGATGFFNPTALFLNGPDRTNADGTGPLNNGIDLNGTNRTFTSNHTNWNGVATTGGVINGAIVNTAGTSAGLIRTGVGNLSLISANTYNGATTLNGGTLTLRTSGTIASTSALNLGGGTLRLVNTANTQRFADVAVSASAGGGVTFENTAGANVYTESLGALTLTKGQVNVLLTNDHNAAAGSQTLTFGTAGTGNLAQGGGRGTITFSAPTTGLNATKNRVAVFGETATAAGGIIGPWATVGTAANVQGTSYAAYDASGFVIPATLTAAAVDTDLASSTGNYLLSNGALVTLAASRTVNAVQFSGTTSTLALSTFKLETYGLFLSGNLTTTKIVSAGIGGALTTPTGGGNLYLTTGQVMTAGSEHRIDAPITNNSGNVNLVKSGAGILRLNGVNTFTGDIDINAGTLQIGTNGTVNGANLNSGNYAGNIFIAAGANLDIQTNSDQILSGIISGDGNLLKRHIGTLTLGDDNTYTGKTTLNAITNATSPTLVVSSFNSFNGGIPLLANSSLGAPTTLANATIQMGSANSTPNPTLRYAGAAATGETTDRIINFTFNSTATRTIDASNGSGLLKFTSPFTADSASTTANLAFTGTGNAEIAGLPFLSGNITKSGNGTWTFAGPTGSVGLVSVSAGTLIATDERALGAAIGNLATTGTTISGTGTLSLRNNSSTTFGVAGTGYNINNSASGATINVDRVSGTGAATMSVGNLTTTSTAATWQLNFTGANGASLTAGALTAPLSTLATTHTISNNIATTNDAALTLASISAPSTNAAPVLRFDGTGHTIVTGNITQTTAALALTKIGSGKVTLSGSATYTGATTITAGTLFINGNSSTAIGAVAVNTGGTLGGSGIIGGAVTVASGATLAPGSSIESLATGSLNLLANATFAQEIDDAFAGGNASGDLTTVNGTLSLAVTNNTILNLFEVGTSGAWSAGNKITLIGYSTGTWNGGLFTYLGNTLNDGSDITFSGTGWTFDYNDTTAGDNYNSDMSAFTATARYVTMTAVPEPNVAALIGALGGILLLRRRR